MTKQLQIGENYITCFAKPEAGASIVYNGGISWTCTTQKGTATVESQKMTDGALELINRPTIMMGSM